MPSENLELSIKIDKEIKKKKRIRNLISTTIGLGAIIGSFVGGYYIGCYDSKPVRMFKTKVKVGYYQYEKKGYIVEDRKGGKYSFEESELENKK